MLYISSLLLLNSGLRLLQRAMSRHFMQKMRPQGHYGGDYEIYCYSDSLGKGGVGLVKP